MSIKAILWAVNYSDVSASEKLVLLILANYADPHGISWPSQPTLAKQACCDGRTIRRVLSQLEKRGVIQRIRRRRTNGSRQSDIIILIGFEGRKPLPPGIAPAPDPDPEPKPRGGEADDPQSTGVDQTSAPPHVDNPVDNRADEPADRPDGQPEEYSGCGTNRPTGPPPPAHRAALDTSVTLQDYNSARAQARAGALKAQYDQSGMDSWELARACEAAGGLALDLQACWANPRSAIEIDAWINAGADPDRDILPTIAKRAAKAKAGAIRSWVYFTEAIMEARAHRLASAPPKAESRREPYRPFTNPKGQRRCKS